MNLRLLGLVIITGTVHGGGFGAFIGVLGGTNVVPSVVLMTLASVGHWFCMLGVLDRVTEYTGRDCIGWSYTPMSRAI